MNKIDEIVIDIDKDKKKAEEKNRPKERKKTSIYKYDLHNWILLLREKMVKKGYKKAIKDIVSAGLINQFKGVDFGYKITIIYIQAKLKVIENKIFKYHINESDKFKHQINRCLHYAKNITIELNNLLEDMPSYLIDDSEYYTDIEKRNLVIEYVDDTIRCYFDYIYIMALFHFKLNNCQKSVAYLTLGFQLFKITKNYILSPHTLFKAQKCFILLSKIYITDEDYQNALSLLNEAIIICFKQILFQVYDIYMGFFVGDKKDIKVKDKSDLNKLKDSRMKRIILNIIIIFLYMGICHENLSNIKKATAFYKQCEWFTRIFLMKDNNAIYKFFFRLKKNSIEVCNIIDFLQERIIEVDKKLKKKMEEAMREEFKKKRGRDNLFFNNKFRKLVEKLDKLKIREIDTISKNERSEMLRNLSATNRKIKDKYFFMTNLRLLEAYLTKDFRNIVINMDKIKLFDLDSITRTKIQRAMENIKFGDNPDIIKSKFLGYSPHSSHKKDLSIKKPNYKSIKIESKNETEKENKVMNKRYSKLILPRQDLKKKLSLNLSTNKYLQNQLRIKSPRNDRKSSKSLLLLSKDSMFNSFMEKKSLNSRNILLSSPVSKEKSNFDSNTKSRLNKTFFEKTTTSPKKSVLNKKIKISFDSPKSTKGHYFLNLRYLKKRNYIKKLGDRELNFQKSLITTKKSPMPHIRYFNKGLCLIEAENSFGKIKSLVSNVNVNNDWKDNMSESEYRDYVLKTKLENAFLNSLNNNALEKYKSLLYKKKDKDQLEDSKYERSLREVDKNNESTLDDLNLKLNAIYENEQKREREEFLKNIQISKQIIKRLYRNKSSIGRNNERNNRFNKKIKFSSSVQNRSNYNIK